MIRIVICDDEKHMSDHIRAMTSDFFRKKNREIQLRTFTSGEELLNYDGQIDILFLDIQMKGMDGMETARKLRADKFRGFLIFITVLKEMVFQSFEVQAYDYLVKPVEEKQFEKTMERLFASMQNAVEDSLLVQKGYEGRIIREDEIIFCEYRKMDYEWQILVSDRERMQKKYPKALVVPATIDEIMLLYVKGER